MKKIIGFIALLSLLLFTCVTKEQNDEFSIVSGRIAVYGTGNFTYIGIKNADDGSFYAVIGDLEPVLRKSYQLQTVKLKGKFLDTVNHEGVQQFRAVEFVE